LVTGRELDSSEVDAVFSEKIDFILHSNMVGSHSDIDISKRSSSGFSIIQGEGDVCVRTGEYNQEILTVGVGTCIVKMSFVEIISYEPYETGPWTHHFFRIDVE